MPNTLLSGLAFDGDRSLLDRARWAFLISRTPRRPAPGTPWVREVVEAVRRVVAQDETIVTGVGRDPYELALRETQRQSGGAVVVLGGQPGGTADEPWRELLPQRRLLVWSESPAPQSGRRRNDRTRLSARDLLIGRLADRAWEIRIRRGGIMSELAEDLRRRRCSVEKPVVTPSDMSDSSDTSDGVCSSEQPEAKCQELGAESEYLCHYTREPDGMWPDESRGAYLDWLATGALDDRRDAFATLKRILEEECVRGSGRLMPNREAMVSFTAAAPDKVARLRRFRPSLHRWDFRPYGLAVRRDVLERLGARAVRYLPEAELKRLAPSERRFAQKHEPPKTDWSREAEWRLVGDLRLRDLPREAVAVLAPTREEAEALAAIGGYHWCVLPGALVARTASADNPVLDNFSCCP